MFHKPILGVTLGMQSLALTGRAIQTIPREFRGKGRVRRGKIRIKRNLFKGSKRRIKVSPIVRGGIDIMTGTALLGPTATIAAAVP